MTMARINDLFEQKQTESLRKLKALTKALPPFPNSIDSSVGFKEYEMTEGSCFAWHIYESKNIGVHRWFSSKGTIFPAHQHKEDEWIFVYEGEMKIIRDEVEEKVQAGQMVNNPPYTIHAIEFDVDTKYITIMYPPNKEYPHERSREK